MGERLPKYRVHKELLVIFQTDPNGRGDNAVISEAVVDHSRDRIKNKEGDHEQGGCKEKIRGKRKPVAHVRLPVTSPLSSWDGEGCLLTCRIHAFSASATKPFTTAIDVHSPSS